MTDQIAETADTARRSTEAAPPVRQLPPLALWLFWRGMKLKEAAKPFGCSAEYVRLICLPFDDPDRRVPTSDVVEAIHAFTQGEIGPADHYPPRLNMQPPSLETNAA